MTMSALPPKADMCSATQYVRFVPIADIGYLCVPNIRFSMDAENRRGKFAT